MNTYKIFFLSVIVLISKCPLKASDVEKQSTEHETKSRYQIAASPKGIFINDRDLNQKLLVEAPEWLRKQDSSCQAEVAIDPDNRFFYLYNPKNCTQYTLGKNELFKAGVIMWTESNYPHPLLRISVDRDTNNRAQLNLTFLIGQKIVIKSIGLAYPWHPKIPRSSYLITCVKKAYEKMFGSYREDSITHLKPEITARIDWWMRNYSTKNPQKVVIKGTSDFYEVVAQAVFEEAYAGQLSSR
jgi:hypothetical protein